MAKINKDGLEKILVKYRTGVASDADRPKRSIPKDRVRKGVPAADSIIAGQDTNLIGNVLKNPRKRTVVITPFFPEDPTQKGMFERYATRATKDSINRMEAPMASHLFFYNFFNNNLVQIERDIGFMSQLSWVEGAELVAVYSDLGITQAMRTVIEFAKLKNIKLEYRTIGSVA